MFNNDYENQVELFNTAVRTHEPVHTTVNVLFSKKGKTHSTLYWAVIRQLPHDQPVIVGKRYGRHGVALEVKAAN